MAIDNEIHVMTFCVWNEKILSSFFKGKETTVVQNILEIKLPLQPKGKESLLFLSWYALLMFLYFFFLSFQTAQSLCFKILQFFTIYSLHLISMFFYSYVLYFLLQTSPL